MVTSKRKKRQIFMYFLFDPPSLRRQTSYKVSILCHLSRSSQSFWMEIKIVLFKNDATILLLQSVRLNRQNNRVLHPVVVRAFSSHAKILGECSTIHSLPGLFFKVEISSRKLIPLFRSGSVHSGSVS